MPNQDQNTSTPDNTGLPPVGQTPNTGSTAKEADMPRAAEPYLQEAPEFEVPPEVSKHVARVPDHIEIPPDLKELGVSTPHSHGKVSDALQKNLRLPITDDEIGSRLKGDPKLSATWQANSFNKVLKQAGFYLKEIGKHFVRVKKAKKII